MDTILQKIMGITIIIFMVGNLLEVGLRLQVADALAALRNVRFLMLSLPYHWSSELRSAPLGNGALFPGYPGNHYEHCRSFKN